MSEGIKWFNTYASFLETFDEGDARKIGDFFLCPCCDFPTLSERASFEICQVCWWEDDGQDAKNADVVLGGPNGSLSLSQARENFQSHSHMYAKGEGIDVVEHPSEARKALIAYVAQVTSGTQELNLSEFKCLEGAL